MICLNDGFVDIIFIIFNSIRPICKDIMQNLLVSNSCSDISLLRWEIVDSYIFIHTLLYLYIYSHIFIHMYIYIHIYPCRHLFKEVSLPAVYFVELSILRTRCYLQ